MAEPLSQQEAIQQFIDLANEMKNNGSSVQAVSSALLRACALYSTYVVAGNDGALKESGVTKLKDLFGSELASIQSMKVRAFEASKQQ
jgi:hypothetical protein